MQTKDDSYTIPLTSDQGGYNGYVPPGQPSSSYAPYPATAYPQQYPQQYPQPSYGYEQQPQVYAQVVSGAPAAYSNATYVGTTVQSNGAPGGYVYMSNTTVQPGAADANNMAVSALVCGILSVVLLPFILSLLAIVFGSIAINRIRQLPKGTAGMGSNLAMAAVGLVLGCLSFVVYIVVIAVVVSNTTRFIEQVVSS